MQERSDKAFAEAIEPLRGGLRLHCYRMLGSSHDGDDVVQETLLRAWRAKDSLRDPDMLRPWLYRIATNACLDELKRRPRRVLASDAYPAAEPLAPIAPAIDEPIWLEPIPDTWLHGDGEADPSVKYTLKESVALAFVAALQVLSPLQRATLLLRDVVGLSAEETAQALAIGLGAANSALFRARSAIEDKLGTHGASDVGRDASDVDEALLARYVRAFENADVDALVAILHEDVVTRMPPSPTWIAGREGLAAFFQKMFAGRTDHASVRLVRTSANGQPALALYRRGSPEEPRRLHAIQVIEVREGAIARIDHFMTREVFPLFGLADEIADR